MSITNHKEPDEEHSLELIWNMLSDKEQEAACVSVWTAPNSSLEAELAEALRFRVKMFAALTPEKKGAHLAKRIRQKAFQRHRAAAIREWILEHHRDLVIAFVGATGLPHSDGMVEADHEDPPTSEALQRGIDKLKEFPQKIWSVYLAYLIWNDDGFWANLQDALRKRDIDLLSTMADKDSETDSAEESEDLVEEEIIEDNQDFTQLDNNLIRTVVAAAFGEEGSLTEDQATDLVEEVVEMSAQRHKSLFHRGFLDSLFERELHFHFRGENEARRLWYFCGVSFGLLRQEKTESCLDLLLKEQELTEALIGNRKVPCGAMLLPHLYPHVLRAERYTLLADWMNAQLDRLKPHSLIHLLISCQEDASQLLRKGDVSGAVLLLNVIKNGLDDEDCRSVLPERLAGHLRPRNMRKLGQVDQLQGDFHSAQVALKRAVKNTKFPSVELSNTLVDLGLIKGPFRSLAEILPQRDESSAPGLLSALRNGKTEYEKAIAEFGASATNAHFCCGMISMLEGQEKASESADHFQHALNGMLKLEKIYQTGGLIDWTRFCLSLTLLETLRENEYQRALKNLDQALESSIQFPLWLWRRAFNAATAFESSDKSLECAGKQLLELRSVEAFKILNDSGMTASSSEIRSACIGWASSASLCNADKWKAYNTYFDQAINQNSINQAETCLDALEILAVEKDKYRKKFLQLLERDQVSSVWESEEILFSRIRCHELSGEFDQAIALLESEFYRLKDKGSSERLNMVALLDKIKADGGDNDRIQNLATLVPEEEQSPPSALQRLKDGVETTVYYIGGNETQEAYQEHIEQELSAKFPGLKIHFFFPGWTSNWNKPLERITSSLGEADIVVLNKMVRTIFGRHIRSACGENSIPWRACTGTGRMSLQRSIENAALLSVANQHR